MVMLWSELQLARSVLVHTRWHLCLAVSVCGVAAWETQHQHIIIIILISSLSCQF